MKQRYWAAARKLEEWLLWPDATSAERRFERGCPSGVDHGSERVLHELVRWLAHAQDRSRSKDGGIARDYSLTHGWATSYPETTGYIVPTFIEYAQRTGEREYLDRARRMLDWLVSIQLPDGGFMGGRIDSIPVVPVTFNTGQILLGLAAGERAFGGYREPMRRAAEWMVDTQDPDGCWRRFPTPFAGPGEKTYETHAAWGLLEAARVDTGSRYAEAALANVRWALKSVSSNGWIDYCSFGRRDAPLTHTIGYALRGVLEAYRYSGDHAFLTAARLTADGALSALGEDGSLPGKLKSDWSPLVKWVCLTGTAQIACCWLMLYAETGESRYAEAAFSANRFVRKTVRVCGDPDTRGAVKGSLPVDGPYGRFQYLNWAAKFLADSLMLEMDLRQRVSAPHAPN